MRVSIKCNYSVFAVDTSMLNILSDFITKIKNPEKHATGNITRRQYFYRCFFILVMYDWLWVLLLTLGNVKALKGRLHEFKHVLKISFPFFPVSKRMIKIWKQFRWKYHHGLCICVPFSSLSSNQIGVSVRGHDVTVLVRASGLGLCCCYKNWVLFSLSLCHSKRACHRACWKVPCN